MSQLKDQIELSVLEAELGTQKALNSMPPLLKWLTIFVVLGIIPIYFATKSIVKNIWLKNYAAGITTAKPSFSQSQAPEVSDVTLTTIGSNVYGAIVKITNPNLDLSADNIPYSFTFYNSKKELLYTSPVYTTFLLPNDSKYVAVPRFTTTEPVSYANFSLDPQIHWQKRLSLPKVTILTSQPNVYSQTSPPALVVEGDYTNKSPYILKNVKLTFLLLDSSKQIIGVSTRDESSVAAFEKRAYKQLWPNVSSSNIFDVKIFAETNTLEPENLGSTAVPTGSASDLSRPTSGN